MCAHLVPLAIAQSIFQTPKKLNLNSQPLCSPANESASPGAKTPSTPRDEEEKKWKDEVVGEDVYAAADSAGPRKGDTPDSAGPREAAAPGCCASGSCSDKKSDGRGSVAEGQGGFSFAAVGALVGVGLLVGALLGMQLEGNLRAQPRYRR